MIARHRIARGWPGDQRRRMRFQVGALETAVELVRRDEVAASRPAFVLALHNRNGAEHAQLVPLDVHAVGLVHRIVSTAGGIMAS